MDMDMADEEATCRGGLAFDLSCCGCDSGEERGGGGLMVAACFQPRFGRSMVANPKRKFDEVDAGAVESSTSAARPRREEPEHSPNLVGPGQDHESVGTEDTDLVHGLPLGELECTDMGILRLSNMVEAREKEEDYGELSNQKTEGDNLLDGSSNSIDEGYTLCPMSMLTSDRIEDFEQLEMPFDQEAVSLFVNDGDATGYSEMLLERGKEKEFLSSGRNVVHDSSMEAMAETSTSFMSPCQQSLLQETQSVLQDTLNVSSPMETSNGSNNPFQSTLQFFVRTINGGSTIVLHSSLGATVESIHHQIQRKIGLPSGELRLIYGGKQMQMDQTLEAYNVTSDATLQLVGRMRSTALPHSWQLVSDLVATIRLLCLTTETKKALQDKVCCQVKEFLKMAGQIVPSSDHMQVFQLTGAGATLALVMLLLSPLESNQRCAEECIKLFTAACDEYLPNHIHCYCAPVLLEFCKLLAKSDPSYDLYTVCRNSLASLLDTFGTAHGTPYFNDAKASFIVEELAPFVDELAIKLASNLRGTAKACALKDKTFNILQQVKEGQDFTAFVIPFCKAMEACKNEREDHLHAMHMEETATWLSNTNQKEVTKSLSYATTKVKIGSQKWLHGVFKRLLEEIDSCLESVEDVIDSTGSSTVDWHPFGWAPFLVVLKGLHAIAKLFEDKMDELLSLLRSHRSALNILLAQSRWHDDNYWLLDYESLLEFESKKRLVMAMLPEPQDDHDERQEVVIRRSQVLSESFECLAYIEGEVLHGGISVEFINEEATGPGVLREWFFLVCREIFNPQNALFLSCPNDRRRVFPNPASGVNPGHLTYFKFCGRFVALALMHRVQIDVVLAQLFFKQLAGRPVCLEDVQDVDPELYSSCKKVLSMDASFFDSDLLELTFVTEVEELGSRKLVELCAGGRERVVTANNREEYVNLLIQRRFVQSVSEQVRCFAQGFSELLVNNMTMDNFFRALVPEDMDLLLYGDDRDISINDWKAHTEYHDYSENDDAILWFWQVVEGMSMEQRRKLLFFSTSVSHLPAEGFSGLSSKFHIHQSSSDPSWLPTAHTCFYQLVLPPYPSLEIMHSRLHTITEGNIAEGFGFA